MKKSYYKKHIMWFFPKPSERRFQKTVRDLVILIAVLLTFRAFSYQHFLIPSGSMIPTLQMGDFVMINKSAYGYSKFNLPQHLPLFQGRIFAKKTPQIGDVIIFVNPKDHKMDYIKRCVGCPGDRVQLRQGKLYINGEVCTYKPADTYKTFDPQGNRVEYNCYEETLPNGVKHIIMRTEDSQDALLMDPRNNTDEFIVPEGHYFAMGDNRNQSRDSRYPDPGFVPLDHFLAQASLVFLSFEFGFWGDIKNPFTWNKLHLKPRWDRFGQRIN